MSYGLVSPHLENPADFPKPVFIRKGLCRDTPQLIYKNVVHNFEKTHEMKKIIGILLIFITLSSCKNEPICSVNENNAGKEIYDLDEASCFIALKLDKKASDLSLIRDALIAEENYMKNIGLISENPNLESETESDIV